MKLYIFFIYRDVTNDKFYTVQKKTAIEISEKKKPSFKIQYVERPFGVRFIKKKV